ncbi:MAG: GyrI-like domain-containing protein [Planctomycetia bacterium]|nr:GyrI-like domain-containing protein [Planctomycetia bacterium]
MGALDSKEKIKELYQPSAADFSMVDVPDLQFVMIDGEGDPGGELFQHLTRWIFAVVHPIRLIARKRMGKDFVEPPLECLWWSDDMNDFIAGKKDKWKWRLMIVTADWLEEEMFEQAVNEASKKLGEVPRTLRLERFAEGKSVQIMHVGPPGSQATPIGRLHEEFLPTNNLIPNGYHHEIYLNDARRVAPEKLRTVLRQPVRSCVPAVVKRRRSSTAASKKSKASK